MVDAIKRESAPVPLLVDASKPVSVPASLRRVEAIKPFHDNVEALSPSIEQARARLAEKRAAKAKLDARLNMKLERASQKRLAAARAKNKFALQAILHGNIVGCNIVACSSPKEAMSLSSSHSSSRSFSHSSSPKELLQPRVVATPETMLQHPLLRQIGRAHV